MDYPALSFGENPGYDSVTRFNPLASNNTRTRNASSFSPDRCDIPDEDIEVERTVCGLDKTFSNIGREDDIRKEGSPSRSMSNVDPKGKLQRKTFSSIRFTENSVFSSNKKFYVFQSRTRCSI
jgi:hypothetical protein